MKTKKHFKAFLLAASAFAAGVSSEAATYDWTGAGSDLLWATGANWSNTGALATISGDTVNFASDIAVNTTVDVGAVNRTLTNLTFSDNGAAGSAWTLSGGTLTLAGTTPTITATTNATISSVLAGTVGANFAGLGTLTLTGTNTYTGGTTINSGATVLVGNGGATGKLGAGALVNNGTLTHTLVGGNITLGGTGNLTGITGSGSSSFSANSINFATVAGGAFSATTTGAQSYVTNSNNGGLIFTNGNSTYNFVTTGGASITMKGDIGAGSAPSSGGAIVNLDTSNGNGAINLDISVGRANQLWNIGSFNANAGTGTISWTGGYGAARGSNSSQGTVNLTGAIDISTTVSGHNSTFALNLNTTAASTISGVLAGTVTLTKTGTANLTLSGNNTYFGATTVNNGTLTLGHATDTLSSSSSVTVDGPSAILAIGNNSDSVGAVTVKNGGSITGGTGTLTGTSYAVESGSISAKLGGTGALTKTTSGTVTLSGANSYTGATNVNVGTLIYGNTASYGSTSHVVASGAVLEFDTGTANLDKAAITFSGSGTLRKTGSGKIQWGGGVATFSFASGALIDVQNGTFVAGSNANDVWTNNKADLNVASGAIFDAAEATSTGNGGIFVNKITGSGTIKVGFYDGNSYANKITFGVDNGTATFDGVLADSEATDSNAHGSFTKAGSGTQTLTGTNTYTGVTTLGAGVLSVATIGNGGVAGNLGKATGAAGNIVFDGGTLKYTGATAASDRAFTINAGKIATIETTNDLTLVGATGTGTTGALTKTGNGKLTLTGANTYTGLTTVSAGSLAVGSSGSLASGNAFTLSASATADFQNAGQTLGAVSNANTAANALNFSASTGTVTLASLTGDGNTRFGSNATVTGGIASGTVTTVGALTAAISGGTVGAGSLSSSSVTGGTNAITGAANITTLNGGATTVGGVATIGTMTSGTANLNGDTAAITTLNGGTVNLGTTTALTVNEGTFSGSITGGSLTKNGSGNLTLGSANSFNGLTVTAGKVTAGNANALGNGTVSITGGELDLGGIAVANTTISVTGGTVSGASGYAGQLNFGGAAGLNGTFAGIVDLGTDKTRAYSTTGLTVTGTLQGQGAVTGNVTVEGAMRIGNSPGTLEVTGNVDLASGSLSTFEIGGTTQGTQYDYLNASGNVTLNGTISIISLAGFDTTTLQADTVFDFIDGNISTGGGYSLNLSGAQLASGLQWDTSNFASTGELRVVSAIPEPSTYGLLGAGSLALATAVRRRRRTAR